MLTLAFDNDPSDYSFESTLGDNAYRFRVYYLDRLGSWFYDIEDLDETPLLQGQRISTNTKISQAVRDVFPGLLVTASTDSQDDSDPGEDALGERVFVAWLTPEELAELA